jgi:hypothetical protein
VSDAQKTVKLEVCTTKKLINHLINVWTWWGPIWSTNEKNLKDAGWKKLSSRTNPTNSQET